MGAKTSTPVIEGSLEYHLQHGMRVCRDIHERGEHASVDPAVLDVILRLVGIPAAEAGTTPRTKCAAIRARFEEIVAAVREVDDLAVTSTAMRDHGHAVQGALRDAVRYLVIALSVQMCAARRVPVSGDDNDNGDGDAGLCRLVLMRHSGDPTAMPLAESRYFVHGDLRPEVNAYADDPEILRRVFDALVGPSPAHRPRGVATFILGGAGAGKGTVVPTRVASPEIRDGMAGAVNLNSDDIMELLPGYTAMLTLGQLDGVPVTSADAADLYHAPAKRINERIRRACVENGWSFVFDGTGNNDRKLLENMRALKERGYTVHAVAVTADVRERHDRVRNRAVRGGRYVPPSVVEKGRSADDWDRVLRGMMAEEVVDRYTVLQN